MVVNDQTHEWTGRQKAAILRIAFQIPKDVAQIDVHHIKKLKSVGIKLVAHDEVYQFLSILQGHDNIDIRFIQNIIDLKNASVCKGRCW